MLGLSGRRVLLVAAVCLLFGSLTGCGSDKGASGDSTQARSPARELTDWYQIVEAEVTKMEEKQREFTRFHVGAQPPAKADLAKLSAAGVRVGETAESGATQLSRVTTLTKEEVEGLYCYFFAFYVDREFAPGREDFEKVITNLVKTRLLGSASPEQVHESADALRESMIRVEKARDPAVEVAAAILC
jgi:hypothetical protein